MLDAAAVSRLRIRCNVRVAAPRPHASLEPPKKEKLEDELAVMAPLPQYFLPEFTEQTITVNGGSTIRMKNNAYSVPARLIGEDVKARIYDSRIEVYFAGKPQLTVERLVGRGKRLITYRHIIQSLVRKPGAFQRYSYRDELFPSLVFRQVYDQLIGSELESSRRTDLEYLRILELAGSHGESLVEAVLRDLLQSSGRIVAATVRDRIVPTVSELPPVEVPAPNLGQYDELLKAVAV